MAKTATAPSQLKKGSKVVATAELRDVPEGTSGKVILVNGLTWIRYWVRFDNGVSIGSINREQLATPADLKAIASGDLVLGAAAEDATDDDAGSGGDGDAAGGVTTPNGTFVPQKFIERAAAARARLAA